MNGEPHLASPCPCQSGLDYLACCGQYHAGQHAPTAEALMRSRYSAYALGLVDYIISTTHRDHPQYQRNVKAWRDSLNQYCKDTQFLGLTILDSVPGKTHSTVTFQAQLFQADQGFILAEKSDFIKMGERWLYAAGQPQIS